MYRITLVWDRERNQDPLFPVVVVQFLYLFRSHPRAVWIDHKLDLILTDCIASASGVRNWDCCAIIAITAGLLPNSWFCIIAAFCCSSKDGSTPCSPAAILTGVFACWACNMLAIVGVLDFLDLSRLRLPPRVGVLFGAESTVIQCNHHSNRIRSDWTVFYIKPSSHAFSMSLFSQRIFIVLCVNSIIRFQTVQKVVPSEFEAYNRPCKGTFIWRINVNATSPHWQPHSLATPFQWRKYW